jgi:hypothetical protein
MRRRLTVVALAAVLVTASACGGGADEPVVAEGGATTDGSDDLDDVQREVGHALEDAGIDLPDVCLSQFLGLMSTPDLGDVALPAAWPEPPVDSTLCKTEGGTELEEVGYATDASPEEVLDAYAEALAEHSPQRTQDDGYGAGTLTGVVDGTGFVIQPRTGSYEIVLGSS